MKKVLVLVSVVCVMCIAGTALARDNVKRNHRPMPVNTAGFERPNMPAGRESPDLAHAPRGMMPRRNQFGHDGRPTFTPDMPPEIREKAAELAKLRVDLEEAMTSRPLNKEKALDVHEKIQKVKQEIEAWRFARRLERIEERQKKGLPPAPETNPTPEKTPQPEPTEIESEE